MARSRIALLVIGFALIAQDAAVAATPTPEASLSAGVACNGKYKGHLKPSPDELAEILKKHAEWLKDVSVNGWSDKAGFKRPVNPKLTDDPRRANLCEATLNGAHLANAQLIGADLSKAHLDGANLLRAHLDGAQLLAAHLDGALLIYADLDGANLSAAHLDGAQLYAAHLDGALLIFADLDGANLSEAHLNGANLYGAHLIGTDLSAAHLEGAQLHATDLNGAYLDFDPDPPLKALDVYDAQNLQLVKYRYQPAGLYTLRHEFKDLGMRTQESQLTYAIRRSELSRESSSSPFYVGPEHYVHSWFERAFNTVFFDWTCQYGMSPGRPLLLVMGFGVFFTVVYTLAQCVPSFGGIWVVWDENRIDKTKGDYPSERLTGFPYDSSARPRGRLRFFLSVVMLAAYFSLLSALRIGWSGLNFGTWITRMQLREYSLHATRWVRLASGLQSLISVLLVALAILTYFGTPFEY